MKKSEKIGGLLILFTIGLFVITFIWTLVFIMSAVLMFTPDVENFWIAILILSFITMITGITSLILEFKKKRKFIMMVILNSILSLVLIILATIYFKDYNNLISGSIGTIIWILYFISSKRVNRTFTK